MNNLDYNVIKRISLHSCVELILFDIWQLFHKIYWRKYWISSKLNSSKKSKNNVVKRNIKLKKVTVNNKNLINIENKDY